ncbi:MAG: HlyD family secretion protein [Anaerolineae bacterium]
MEMNVKRLGIGLILIVILVSGGYWAYLQFLAPTSEPAVVAAPTQQVVAPASTDTVSAEGKITPLRHASLSFQTGGRVAKLLVSAGDAVEAGDPLARLEATELEIALSQADAAVAQAEAGVQAAQAQLAAAQAGLASAQAGITSAQAQLALVKAGPSPEEIVASEAQVAVAESGIEQAVANRELTLAPATAAQRRAAEARVAAAAAEERVRQDQYDALVNNDVLGTQEEQARFALRAAEANLIAAQAALDELNAGAPPEQRRVAEAAVSVATAQRDAAQAQLELLLAGAKEEQIAVAEAGVAQAEAAVTQAEAAVVQAEAGVAQAEATVGQAEAARDAAQAALDKMTLTAPFDGVVASLPIEEGEVVAPGAPVAVLADFSAWLVETTDLTELDIVSVAVGFPVSVRVDAIPDTILQGTVSEIAHVSGLTRGDVTYAVTVRLEDYPELPIRWGMTAFVDVQLAQ